MLNEESTVGTGQPLSQPLSLELRRFPASKAQRAAGAQPRRVLPQARACCGVCQWWQVAGQNRLGTGVVERVLAVPGQLRHLLQRLHPIRTPGVC